MSKNEVQKTPELYNPKIVCAASLLFTPIFGALLQTENWLALGRRDEAAASRCWVRASVWLVMLFLMMQTLFRREAAMSWIGPYFLLVLWAAWMLLSGRKQLSYLKAAPRRCRSRPLGKPVLLGAAGWLFYGLISAALAMALVLFGFEPPEGSSSDAVTKVSPGVTITLPEGAKEPVVTPLPADERGMPLQKN